MDIIVAPHIDDEVIGCYSILSTTKAETEIWYLTTEASKTRRDEAKAVSKMFGVEIRFMPMSELSRSLKQMCLIGTVYVPSRQDLHPHHRKVTSLVTNVIDTNLLRYYSVDMNIPGRPTLPKKIQDAKRKALYELYPSQATLLKNNDKYWLFEDIRDTDMIHSFIARNIGIKVIASGVKRTQSIRKILEQELNKAKMEPKPERLLNKLLAHPSLQDWSLEVTIGNVSARNF